jgi:hypothetical protein
MLLAGAHRIPIAALGRDLAAMPALYRIVCSEDDGCPWRDKAPEE